MKHGIERNAMEQLNEMLTKRKQTICLISLGYVCVIGDRTNYYSISRRIQTILQQGLQGQAYLLDSAEKVFPQYQQFVKADCNPVVISFEAISYQRDEVVLGIQGSLKNRAITLQLQTAEWLLRNDQTRQSKIKVADATWTVYSLPELLNLEMPKNDE